MAQQGDTTNICNNDYVTLSYVWRFDNYTVSGSRP